MDLYINVHTDVYARDLVPAAGKTAEAIRRAQVYREAGADGIFVLGLADAEEMRALFRN